MGDQNHNPWLLEPGNQQGLALDFPFNPVVSEDAGFLDGFIYNPLAAQNGPANEGFAQSASEDYKPQADEGLPNQSSWIRGGDRNPSQSPGQQGSGNLMFLHHQQLQPLSRAEPAQTAATGTDSGTRSQDDEVTAARREMKSNREKLLRDRMNEHFAELANVLDPGRPPKTDKHSVLTDGVNMVRKLRDEITKLQSEHKLLLDESKELTAEKTELREERMQVKAEKEALERRLQGMLSWMNFNPSLMMAAIANSAHPPPQTDPSATPPQNSGPPQQNGSVEPQEISPPVTEGGGGGTERENQMGKKVPPTQAQVSQRNGASSSRGVQSQGLAVRDALLSMGGGARGQEGRTAKVTEGQPAALGGASNRGTSRGGVSHPTRPQPVYQAVHFGTPTPQPAPQVRGGPRRLLPATDRTPPEQPRQPNNLWHQQQKAACMQPASVRQSAPPSQSSKSVPGTAPMAPHQPKGGKESGRKVTQQIQSNIQPTAEGAPSGIGPTRGGHVAACGAPVAEERRGQVAGSGHSEKPAVTPPQPAEQSPSFQQPHPFSHPFPHMPYMGAFPGMMGMHPYSYPPQMAVPNATPPTENTPQPPNAHFAYPAYGYGQPGNPAGYPYPMFPHAHPMAYPPFGFPHPYGAPGMGAFTPPPGSQQAQGGGTGPGNVQRPSAKVAQVQVPTGGSSVEGGQGDQGNKVGENVSEQGRESHSLNGSDEPLQARSNQQPLGEDGPNKNGRPESADSQSAKRAKVAASGEEACRPLESVPGFSTDHVQETGTVVQGLPQGEANLQGATERSVTTAGGPQASPALAVSQPSNCSSSSSGSRCGELWTQSFQSALEMPENDPTIRPPAA